MRTVRRWLTLLLALSPPTTGAALAAGDPAEVLVVVEKAEGACCGPDDVRRAIAARTGLSVVAPSQKEAAATAGVLLIALGPDRAALTVRSQSRADLRREVALPPQAGAQLRTLSLLAENLLRDQVGELVMAGRPDALTARAPGGTRPEPRAAAAMPLQAPMAQVATSSALTSAAHAAPSNVPAPSTTPPPLDVHAAGASLPGEAQRREATVWRIAALGGPTLALPDPGALRPFKFSPGSWWQLELDRSLGADGWLGGVALETGPGAAHILAGVLFGGATWRRGSWFVDATGGVGLEASRVVVTEAETSVSSDGPSRTTLTHRMGTRPTFHARGTASVGKSIAPAVDLIVRAGARLMPQDVDTSFGGVTLGLRVALR